MMKATLNDRDYMYLRDQILSLQTQLNRIERCFYRLLKSCQDSIDTINYSVSHSEPDINPQPKPDSINDSNSINNFNPIESIKFNTDIDQNIPEPLWFKDQEDHNDLFRELINVIIKDNLCKQDAISPQTCKSLKDLYPNKEDRILAVDGDCFITREIHKLNYVFCFAYKQDPTSESGYTRELSTLDERLTKHGNNSTKFYLKFAIDNGLLSS